MIAPTDRLLQWTAVLLPVAAIGGLVPAAAAPAAGIAVCLGLAAVADAVNASKRLCGVRLTIPETTRLSRGEDGAIPVHLHNITHCRALRLALDLPPAFEPRPEPLDIALPEGEDSGIVEWNCRGLVRGGFDVERGFVDTLSGLGLWRVRRCLACHGRIRVYPSLLRERRRLAAVFLNRGAFGLHTQRQLGQGREFEKLRHYMPGDSYDDIHWKATAKRGYPVTKLFQIERTQEIYVVVDASRLSAREQNGEAMIEPFVTAALVLGLAAERQGDHFGLIAFDSGVRRFVRAAGGKSHFNTCREALYNVHAQPVSPAYDELFTFVRTRLRRRALLLVLTDLGDPALAERFSRHLDLVCRQHVVLVAMPQHGGMAPLYAGESGAGRESIYRELGGHIVWNRLQEVARDLGRRGVGFTMVDHRRLGVELVSQYMKIKARQLI